MYLYFHFHEYQYQKQKDHLGNRVDPGILPPVPVSLAGGVGLQVEELPIGGGVLVLQENCQRNAQDHQDYAGVGQEEVANVPFDKLLDFNDRPLQ